MEGYFCYCSPGYQIKSDEQNKCVDVNECMDTLLNDCHTSADCMNSVGSYRCQCRTGFIGDGKTPCTRKKIFFYINITKIHCVVYVDAWHYSAGTARIDYERVIIYFLLFFHLGIGTTTTPSSRKFIQ